MGFHRVKPLTEGGILTAVSVAMALMSIYVPLLGTAVAFIWPLPIIILVVRHGIRWGILASAVSGVLIALLVHPLQALSMTIAFGPVGLMIGYNYRRGSKAVSSLLWAMGVSIFSKIAVIGLSALVLNINPLHMQLDIMDEAFRGSLEVYRDAGMNEAELAKMETDFKAGMETVRLLFPIIIALAGMLDAYVNFLVSGRVLHRLGNKESVVLPPFQSWRLPLWVPYLYAFALLGMYWGPQLESALLFQVSLNASWLANVLGFVQGLSLLSIAADRYRVRGFIRAIALFLLVINGFFLQVVALTGMFDIVFDIRRRMTSRG